MITENFHTEPNLKNKVLRAMVVEQLKKSLSLKLHMFFDSGCRERIKIIYRESNIFFFFFLFFGKKNNFVQFLKRSPTESHLKRADDVFWAMCQQKTLHAYPEREREKNSF